MFTEAERSALREHAAVIDRFEAEMTAEKDRISAPYKDRIREVAERVAPELFHGFDPKVAPHSGFYPDGSPVLIEPSSDPGDHRQIHEISAEINTALMEWAVARRPAIDPWDTPGKLVTWIEERLEGLRIRAWAKRSTSGKSRSPDAPPEHDDGPAARDAFMEARRRAEQFASLAPSLLGQPPADTDPVIGMTMIRDWFICLVADQSPPRTANHPEDEAPPQLPYRAPRSSRAPRNRPGDSKIRIIATLDSLAATGEWNKSATAIIEMARVSRTTFNRLLREDVLVKRVMQEFKSQQLGRGPARASQF